MKLSISTTAGIGALSAFATCSTSIAEPRLGPIVGQRGAFLTSRHTVNSPIIVDEHVRVNPRNGLISQCTITLLKPHPRVYGNGFVQTRYEMTFTETTSVECNGCVLEIHTAPPNVPVVASPLKSVILPAWTTEHATVCKEVHPKTTSALVTTTATSVPEQEPPYCDELFWALRSDCCRIRNTNSILIAAPATTLVTTSTITTASSVDSMTLTQAATSIGPEQEPPYCDEPHWMLWSDRCQGRNTDSTATSDAVEKPASSSLTATISTDSSCCCDPRDAVCHCAGPLCPSGYVSPHQ